MMIKTKIFRAIPGLCTGCDICTLVCSLSRSGVVNPQLARIKVNHSNEHGLCSPLICRHCKKPLCLDACPVTGAMYPDERTSAVVIDPEKCIGCLACADACPFQAIQVGPRGEVLKCDLCGGDPLCVKYCPPRPARQNPHLPYPSASCLEYAEPHRLTKKLARERALVEAIHA